MFTSEDMRVVSSCLGIDIKLVGGLFVVNDRFFQTFNRAISYAGKTFDLQPLLKKDRCLNIIKSKVEAEDTEYTSMKWSLVRHKYLENDELVEKREKYYIAKKHFTIEAEFGRETIYQGNRLIELLTTDDMPAGLMIVYGNKQPVIFAPDNTNLKFLNHKDGYGKATINSMYAHRNLESTKKNIVFYGTIPSLINSCKAGLTHTILANGASEVEFCKAASQDIDIIGSKTVRINGKTVMETITEHILGFSTKQAREAAINVMASCKKTGQKVPQKIVDILATLSRDRVRVDEETKRFIFGLLDGVYAVSKNTRSVFVDKYSGKSFAYTPKADHATARKIAKNLLTVATVKDLVSDLTLEDIIFCVHEYARTGHREYSADDGEDWYNTGAMMIRLIFENGTVAIDDIPKKNKRKAEKWMSDARWNKLIKIGKSDRLKTFSFMFNSEEDAEVAFVKTISMQIAAILGIDYGFSVSAKHKRDYRFIKRFVTAQVFNFIGLKEKNKYGNKDGVVFTEDKDEAGSLRVLLTSEFNAKSDVALSERKLSQYELMSYSRMQSVETAKWMPYVFMHMLIHIAKTYNDIDHAREHLSISGNIESIVRLFLKKVPR